MSCEEPMRTERPYNEGYVADRFQSTTISELSSVCTIVSRLHRVSRQAKNRCSAIEMMTARRLDKRMIGPLESLFSVRL